MSAIRVVVQSNIASAELVAATLGAADAIRAEAGCLQFEVFKGIEFAENLTQLELWETAAAYDRHWRRVRDTPALGGLLADGAERLSAPYHHGTPQAPRLEGLSGIEIYPQALFVRSADNVWVRADERERVEAVRWPARSAVRIAIQNNLATEDEPRTIKTCLETRGEPGCLQFEYFRSLQFPENTVLLELWRDPDIYDLHFLNRLKARKFASEPPQARSPSARAHGQGGFEWYQHTFFTEIDGVWQPETPGERMVTVRW